MHGDALTARHLCGHSVVQTGTTQQHLSSMWVSASRTTLELTVPPSAATRTSPQQPPQLAAQPATPPAARPPLPAAAIAAACAPHASGASAKLLLNPSLKAITEAFVGSSGLPEAQGAQKKTYEPPPTKFFERCTLLCRRPCHEAVSLLPGDCCICCCYTGYWSPNDADRRAHNDTATPC